MPSGPEARPDPSRAEPFRCVVLRERDSARIRVVGELDMATAAILRTEIDSLRAEGIRRMILDLSSLDFMDSSGLRCILDCDAEARKDGFSVGLIQGPPAVHRVFELTKTVARLPFIDP
jgi:anti-sigma B factor antagonist